MKLLETAVAPPDRLEYLVRGIVQDEPGIRLTPQQDADWQELMDTLVDWARDPGDLEDEGVEPPDSSTIKLASELAGMMRDRDIEPPDRLAPNGDGGLVFRWRSGQTTWTVEFDMDGSVESSLVRSGRLVCRQSLHGEPHA